MVENWEAEYRQLVLFPTADASGYDPIEDRLRANVRATIEAMLEEERVGFLVGFVTGAATSGPGATATGIAIGS